MRSSGASLDARVPTPRSHIRPDASSTTGASRRSCASARPGSWRGQSDLPRPVDVEDDLRPPSLCLIGGRPPGRSSGEGPADWVDQLLTGGSAFWSPGGRFMDSTIGAQVQSCASSEAIC